MDIKNSKPALFPTFSADTFQVTGKMDGSHLIQFFTFLPDGNFQEEFRVSLSLSGANALQNLLAAQIAKTEEAIKATNLVT